MLTGGAEEGANARRQLAFAHALQALIDEDAVVAVELDHVGHRAERDQIEQGRKIRLLALIVEPAALAQLGA